MPSSDLSHWLLLAQRLFHDLVALLCVPSTRFGHLFPPAGSPAFLWPSYSHLSRVPNLMGRDRCPALHSTQDIRFRIRRGFLSPLWLSPTPPPGLRLRSARLAGS